MTDQSETGVATQVRSGGTYTIDPETGAARLVDPPSAPPPGSAPAAPETRQKKVK